ncbi:WD40-repeat-containing domain protein [Phlyctochytrium arcticum]|nr:WD40-repeat-containing domain protein [Phlyctochytrium arcticum]
MADPAPLPIDHVSQVFSLAFHPEEDIVASGLITGEVYGYRYNGGEEAVKVFESTHHKESCRALEFSVDGLSLYTGSRDQSLQVIDTTTGKVTLRKPAAHADAINTLRVVGEQHTLLASGDDSGCVKIWDTRERKCVMKYHENVDFISDMTFVANKRTLVCTSGDGCLSVFDIRKKKPVAISENQDDELLSIVPVRNSSKVVVGTQTGTLLLFSWGDWGDCTDRFPGHPSSVDSMASLDDSVIMTASGDGILRAIRILPNELVGAVGDHGEMAVESIRVSRDRKWVGSCAHDGVIMLMPMALKWRRSKKGWKTKLSRIRM